MEFLGHMTCLTSHTHHVIKVNHVPLFKTADLSSNLSHCFNFNKLKQSLKRGSTQNRYNMATPMDQDNPTGSSAPHADTPSMTDIIQALKATSCWKLFSGNHFITLCHNKGCTACTEYITHLMCGTNVGELGPRPSSLSQALDKAWPEAMTHICKDADEQLHDELHMAHRIIEEQTDEIDGLQKDGDKIYADYKVERAHCHEAEESLTCLKGKAKETVGMTMRSSSSLTKRKV